MKHNAKAGDFACMPLTPSMALVSFVALIASMSLLVLGTENASIAAPHKAAPHKAAPHKAAPHKAAPHKAAPHKASHTQRHHVSGKATIYSDKFNGKRTANGERFRQNQLTAASPYLPIGSKVKVVNKANKKAVTVRINDRQPKGGNRVIDLSKSAAKHLGIKGTGSVDTTVIKK